MRSEVGKSLPFARPHVPSAARGMENRFSLFTHTWSELIVGKWVRKAFLRLGISSFIFRLSALAWPMKTRPPAKARCRTGRPETEVPNCQWLIWWYFLIIGRSCCSRFRAHSFNTPCSSSPIRARKRNLAHGEHNSLLSTLTRLRHHSGATAAMRKAPLGAPCL